MSASIATVFFNR